MVEGFKVCGKWGSKFVARGSYGVQSLRFKLCGSEYMVKVCVCEVFAELSISPAFDFFPSGGLHGVQQVPALCFGSLHLTGRNCTVTVGNCTVLQVGTALCCR